MAEAAGETKAAGEGGEGARGGAGCAGAKAAAGATGGGPGDKPRWIGLFVADDHALRGGHLTLTFLGKCSDARLADVDRVWAVLAPMLGKAGDGAGDGPVEGVVSGDVQYYGPEHKRDIPVRLVTLALPAQERVLRALYAFQVVQPGMPDMPSASLHISAKPEAAGEAPADAAFRRALLALPAGHPVRFDRLIMRQSGGGPARLMWEARPSAPAPPAPPAPAAPADPAAPTAPLA